MELYISHHNNLVLPHYRKADRGRKKEYFSISSTQMSATITHCPIGTIHSAFVWITVVATYVNTLENVSQSYTTNMFAVSCLRSITYREYGLIELT